MIITQVLNDFIQCWAAYNHHEKIDEDTIIAINSGDCGLVATAVHYVLKERFNIETAILSNRSHCWLGFEKKDYDTKHTDGYPEGTDANTIWSKGELDNVNRDTFDDSCTEWMPCDSFGGYLVKGFVERYGLALPKELQHLIDDASEYESPDSVMVLIAKEDNVSKIPLPTELTQSDEPFKETHGDIKVSNPTTPTSSHNPIIEFLKDLRENPNSFPGIDHRELVKVFKDLKNQALFGIDIAYHPLFSLSVKPKYISNIIPLVKPGFKDRLPMNLDGVVLELVSNYGKAERIQLVIHASSGRSAHLALRVRYKEEKFSGYGIIPCTTSNLLKVHKLVCK